MTALVLRTTRLDVDQGPFLVPFLIPRYRSIKPNAQYYESECFFQPFQMDVEEKKTEVSGIVYNFEFIFMVFFAISHIFFRNRRTLPLTIYYVFLSQLNYTLKVYQIKRQNVCQIEYQKIYQIK